MVSMTPGSLQKLESFCMFEIFSVLTEEEKQYIVKQFSSQEKHKE